MSGSSRSRARSWAPPRHRRFEETLRVAAAAWFAAKGYSTLQSRPYLLTNRDEWPHNIILSEVADYVAAERKRRLSQGRNFPLHKYVHHGLSSQAMLFNLLGPLIISSDLRPLQLAAERQGIAWPTDAEHPILEYDDRIVFNEDAGQPTSIDLAICNEAGVPRLCIEAKLVEREFGACSVFLAGDCDGRNPTANFSLCYLHHIGRHYWEMLDKHGFLAGSIGHDALCHLSIHYQFWRELVFAVECGGIFVLLYDERSPTFIDPSSDGRRGLWPLLTSFVPEHHRDRVGSISVQQVLAAARSAGGHAWIDEYERKYGLA